MYAAFSWNYQNPRHHRIILSMAASFLYNCSPCVLYLAPVKASFQIGVKFPWGWMSVGQKVFGFNCIGVKCPGWNVFGEKCPDTQANEKWSQTNIPGRFKGILHQKRRSHHLFVNVPGLGLKSICSRFIKIWSKHFMKFNLWKQDGSIGTLSRKKLFGYPDFFGWEGMTLKLLTLARD